MKRSSLSTPNPRWIIESVTINIPYLGRFESKPFGVYYLASAGPFIVGAERTNDNAAINETTHVIVTRVRS